MLILSVFGLTTEISTEQLCLYSIYLNTLLISSQEINVKHVDRGKCNYACVIFGETFKEKENIDFSGKTVKDLKRQASCKES